MALLGCWPSHFMGTQPEGEGAQRTQSCIEKQTSMWMEECRIGVSIATNEDRHPYIQGSQRNQSWVAGREQGLV